MNRIRNRTGISPGAPPLCPPPAGSAATLGGVTTRATFGETPDADAFFTGKPQIGELGYAFLFRNYRADHGKWNSADPLGYPDGWNNLAYVNNGVTDAIDWLGGAAHAISSTEYLYFANGSAKFTVIISAYCNDNYESPNLSDVAVNKTGTTNVTVGISFSLGNVDFGASASINFDSVSGSVVKTTVVDNKNGTKTITADIYVSYKITGKEVLLIGSVEKIENGNTIMHISCTIAE